MTSGVDVDVHGVLVSLAQRLALQVGDHELDRFQPVHSGVVQIHGLSQLSNRSVHRCIELGSRYIAARITGFGSLGSHHGVIGGHKNILASAVVAGLGIVGSTCLITPSVDLLIDQSHLPIRLTVALRIGTRHIGHSRLVGAVGLGQIVQVISESRSIGAADRAGAERRERHDVAVELSDPVDEPVTTGVGDEPVPARASVGDIFV